MYLIPPFLQNGDRIEIITPAGGVDLNLIYGAQQTLSQWGFHATIAPHAENRYGRYAGTTEQRLSDLTNAICNSEVKALLCSRGGYGIMQLIEHLPGKLLRNHPKWIIGYSDITALHAWAQQAGVASLHAPMAKHMTEEGADDSSSRSLFDLLTGKSVAYNQPAHPLNQTGSATGTLRGGNLSVLQGLRGTPYDLPQNERFILFLEDIGEPPYKVERMLLNLHLGGIFARCQAVIIGQFTEYEEDPGMGKSLFELIDQILAPYRIPVCYNFPVGHVKYNLALLCGAQARLDIKKEGSTLTFCV